MRIRIGTLLLTLWLSAASVSAAARTSDTDFCKTIVLRPIAYLYEEGVDENGVAFPATAAPPVVEKGRIIRRVTQYVVDRKTGLTGFCAHFDTCYRATATVDGRQVKAQRLLNCKIDFKHPDKEDDTIYYGLDLDPRRNSAHDLRIDRTTRKLSLDIDLDWLAILSVEAPRSKCARTVRRALTGDRRARELLRSLSPYDCGYVR